MLSSTPISIDAFRRLPGLYRRWELIEILHPGAHYQLEDAGQMQDGTPLLAVFMCDPFASEHAVRADALASLKPALPADVR